MENNSEINHGQEDRQGYWAAEIKDKSPEEVARIIADFENRATRDKLTGLINEEEFKIQFAGFSEGAIRRAHKVYVLFMDFDELKKVNDTEGHEKGNEYLKRGSEIISSSLRRSDLVGRLHGDEFVAAIEFDGGLPESNPENVAQRLVTNLENGSISISFGMKEFKKGDDLVEIMSNADRYMKLDKTDRKAGREFNS